MRDHPRLKQFVTLPWHIPDGEKTWLPKKPEPLGEWIAWEVIGMNIDIRGWTLKVHPVFEAQVRTRNHPPKGFEWSVNDSAGIGIAATLEDAQMACERKIVTLVRAMLPAYLIVRERALAQTDPPRGQGCTSFTSDEALAAMTEPPQKHRKV